MGAIVNPGNFPASGIVAAIAVLSVALSFSYMLVKAANAGCIP